MTIKVKELIEKLQDLNPESEIRFEVNFAYHYCDKCNNYVGFDGYEISFRADAFEEERIEYDDEYDRYLFTFDL